MLRTAKIVGLALAALAGGLLVAGPATAGGVQVGIHFGVPFRPAPVYVAPPVVVVPAPPGYWTPAPVYVAPAPVYGVPRYPRRNHVIVSPGHGHGHRHLAHGHWYRGHGHPGHPGHGHWKSSVHPWHR